MEIINPTLKKVTLLLSELHIHLLKPSLCVHVTGQLYSNVPNNPCSTKVLFTSLCSDFRVSSFVNDVKQSFSHLSEMCAYIYIYIYIRRV